MLLALIGHVLHEAPAHLISALSMTTSASVRAELTKVGSNIETLNGGSARLDWPIGEADYIFAVALVVVAGLGRVLEAGKGLSNLEAWRLGPDLCLAGMSVDLTKFLEWWREPGSPIKDDVARVFVAFAIAVIAYILVLCFHQTWAHSPRKERFYQIVQNLMLILVCNFLGLAAVLSFLLFPRL